MKAALQSILLLFVIQSAVVAQDLYFPPIGDEIWESIDPAELGWNVDLLPNLYSFLEEEESRGFLVLKNGKIVIEEYFNGFTSDSSWVWFSAGKSFQATLAGILQENGFFLIEESSQEYLGAGWSSMTNEQELAVSIKDHLTMSTGLDERFSFSSIARDQLRYRFDAGTRWYYHNSPYNLLREIMENATGSTINGLSNQYLENKIGMTGFWVRSGDNAFHYSTLRDFARFGLLTLNKGIWDETVVLGDITYYNAMVNTSQDLNKSYGYLWWLNGKESYINTGSSEITPGKLLPNAPDDAFAAIGANGQFIVVVPSQQLVLVRIGDENSNGMRTINFLDELWENFESISEVLTSNEGPSYDPVAFSLDQNYPNPFNPSTNISFSIDQSGSVQLEVFDLLGQKIETLLTGDLQAGEYEMSFDATNLTSGIYIYRLSTEIGQITRMMTLVK